MKRTIWEVLKAAIIGITAAACVALVVFVIASIATAGSMTDSLEASKRAVLFFAALSMFFSAAAFFRKESKRPLADSEGYRKLFRNIPFALTLFIGAFAGTVIAAVLEYLGG